MGKKNGGVPAFDSPKAAKTSLAPMADIQDFELSDGSSVPLCLTWGLLYGIKRESPDEYRSCCEALVGKDVREDMLALLDVLYCAYLCGRAATGAQGEALSADEFRELAPMDLTQAMEAYRALVFPKSTAASQPRS